MENEDENENALTSLGNEVEDAISLVAEVFRRFRRRRCRREGYVSREDKRAKRINSPYRLCTHRRPSKNIFRSSLTSVVPKRVD